MIRMGISSIVGTRKGQEDTACGRIKGEKAIAIVCDGMGGLGHGAKASQLAAERLLEAYFCREDCLDVPAFLRDQLHLADEQVHQLRDAKGRRIRAGTTIIAVIIQNGVLYWAAAGDSKLYILRDGEILAVNREHNYQLTLDTLLAQGRITRAVYEKEAERAGALTSYLGMGGLKLIDQNRYPFELQKNDMMLLSSDGLHRSLSQEEIAQILMSGGAEVQRIAERLTAAALGGKKSGQDNTSAIVIQY